jgi:hypothetical protein
MSKRKVFASNSSNTVEALDSEKLIKKIKKSVEIVEDPESASGIWRSVGGSAQPSAKKSSARKSAQSSSVTKSPWRRVSKRLEKIQSPLVTKNLLEKLNEQDEDDEEIEPDITMEDDAVDRMDMLISLDSDVNESVMLDTHTIPVPTSQSKFNPKLTVITTPYATPFTHNSSTYATPNQSGNDSTPSSAGSTDSFMGSVRKTSPSSISTPFQAKSAPRDYGSVSKDFNKSTSKIGVSTKRVAGTRRISDTPLRAWPVDEQILNVPEVDLTTAVAPRFVASIELPAIHELGEAAIHEAVQEQLEVRPTDNKIDQKVRTNFQR